MKKQLLWLPAVAMTLALTGQVAYYRFVDTPVVETHASWAFHPNSMAEAQAKASTIVQGQVVSVAAGPDIVTFAKGEATRAVQSTDDLRDPSALVRIIWISRLDAGQE